MAILRSLDGKFYEVPDDQVQKFLIPEDKVKEKLQACGVSETAPPEGPPSGAPATPTVLVQIFGGEAGQGGGAPAPTADMPAPATAAEVQPYSAHWHNYWRNYWHNHWRNNWCNYWRNWYGG